jgi:hypothetical protein
MCFEKYRVSAQNPKGLSSLWFYQKMSLCGDNKPKIHKYRVSAQNTKRLAFTFTEKHLSAIKNWPNIHILSLWDPYSCSVRHYSIVHNCFKVLKNIVFWLKTQTYVRLWLAFGITEKVCSLWKWSKICISSTWGPYYVSIIRFDNVHKF